MRARIVLADLDPEDALSLPVKQPLGDKLRDLAPFTSGIVDARDPRSAL